MTNYYSFLNNNTSNVNRLQIRNLLQGDTYLLHLLLTNTILSIDKHNFM